MNAAATSLQLSMLLGSCFVWASGNVLAEDQFANPVNVRRVTHASLFASRVVKVNDLQETVQHHSPIADSGSPALSSQSDPIEPSQAEDASVNIPHAEHLIPDSNVIIGDCLEIDGSASGGANRQSQHPAPEVVLRFSSGCTDAEFVNWKLSSRDTPRAQPAVPHGPLTVELLVDKPIDFVELMFDGKPLKPTTYATASPLTYSLPCPAPGQHWLQARYLSGNIWSLYSNPIRFEVRLPTQPRIIAASDFDRDPTSLPRNSMTSITTHSIKVHLADVNRGDNIVAYVDGKPLPPHSHTHDDVHPMTVETDNQLCCRVFRVEGAVIPGDHKLTVRVVGCSGECSITSQPSNAITFHYYDEDIYLLRPGRGCNNNSHATNAYLPPVHGAAASRIPLNSTNAIEEVSASNFDGKYRFVALLTDTPNPAAEAARMLELGQRFRDMTAADVANLKVIADEAAEHALATAAAADVVEKTRDNSSAVRGKSAVDARESNRFASQAANLDDVELNVQINDAKTGNKLAQAADAKVQKANEAIEQVTKIARVRADSCQSHAYAALESHAACSEFLRRGTEALAKAQAFAHEARLAQDANSNAAAEQARQKTVVEVGKIQNAQQAAAELIAPARGHQQAAAELRKLVATDLEQAKLQLAVIQTESKTVAEKTALAKTSFETARGLVVHLQNPVFLAVRSDATSARVAYNEAADAAQRASERASEATEQSEQAKSVAELAHASSDNSSDALAKAGAAQREALDAAHRADAAVQKAHKEAEKLVGSSFQSNVAKRAASVAQSERDAAYRAAAEANAAYAAALTYSKEVAAGARDADARAKDALSKATEARRYAKAAATARDAALQATLQAEQVATNLFVAIRKNENVAVVSANSIQTASIEKTNAERFAREAAGHEADTLSTAASAEEFAKLANAAGDQASRVDKASKRAEEFRQISVSQTNAAESNAAQAGLTNELQQQLKSATENTQVAALQDNLRSQVDNASGAQSEGEIRRADLAESQAMQAEARSDARIRQYEANARTARANSVMSSPSPFYFAAAAHFPLREFGLRGEPLDRDGIIIYEDMAFHFDRDGNYEVHFRASAPRMPATMRLQFQIQPHRNGPWYTVTLAPIEFPYSSAKSKKTNCSGSNCGDDHSNCSDESMNCCGEARECVCKGHSEILRRCYGEMGEGAKIRRSGNARFGFGVDVH